MREYYLVLADKVTDGLRAVREWLEDYLQDRTVPLKKYIRSTEYLYARLGEANDLFNANAERQSPNELVISLGMDPDSVAATDLMPGPLVAQVSLATSNYVALLNITETTPLTPDIVQRKLAQTRTEEAVITDLLSEARARAARIELLLRQRSVDLVSPAAPVMGDATAEHRVNQENTLQLLAAVFLLLAIVLFVSIYRRAVVIPMHQRMIESTASAEYQRKLDHFARVATGLAHEIRNPLTAISIRLFTLQKSLTPGSAQSTDAVLIRNEIDRLEQIVKNFLRLARPSEPKLVRLTPRPLLEETRSLLQEQCGRQGIELQVEPSTDTPFLGDAAQLKQVLINLVQNAAESITGPGKVILRAYEHPAQNGSTAGPDVILEIEDTGGGIPAEVQERLFDPFFSTKENGTGLGLPIAAKIVDQHKGRMEFESKAGEGATFRVILPMAREKILNA
jgi:signal transduction histidine kinase